MKIIFATPDFLQTAQVLLIVIGSIFFAFLGYKLFMYGIETGLNKVKTTSKAQRIFYSGIGPGSILMALGIVGLFVSLFANYPSNGGSEPQVVMDTAHSNPIASGPQKAATQDAEPNDFINKNTVMFAVLCIVLIGLLIYLNYKLPRKELQDAGLPSEIVSKAQRIEYLERLIEMNAFQL